MAQLTQDVALVTCPDQGTGSVRVTFDDVTGAIASVTIANTSTRFTACLHVFLSGVEVSGSPFRAAPGLNQTISLAGLGLAMVKAADGTWDFNFSAGIAWSAGCPC